LIISSKTTCKLQNTHYETSESPRLAKKLQGRKRKLALDLTKSTPKHHNAATRNASNVMPKK